LFCSNVSPFLLPRLKASSYLGARKETQS
jgi:hypothetical protein